MPPSCLGHVRQSTVRLNHTRAPTYGNVSIRPRTPWNWVFQYHCVCVDASISNQFWNTDPHLPVAHYRRPNGLPKAPRLGSPKEGALTLCLDTSQDGAAAAHGTSVFLFHTIFQTKGCLYSTVKTYQQKASLLTSNLYLTTMFLGLNWPLNLASLARLKVSFQQARPFLACFTDRAMSLTPFLFWPEVVSTTS